MIRRPPRSTQGVSSAASDVYKRQGFGFDGDGDRVGVIDNCGNEIFADKIGLLICLLYTSPSPRD